MTAARLPTGITAAKGLATLPDGGMFLHWQQRRQGLAALPNGGRPSHGAHWPSILLRQGYGGQGRSALPRRVHVSSLATTAAKCLAALPDGGTFPHGHGVGEVSRRPTGHHGGEGSSHPTKRWQAFPRAHWPSILLRQGYGGQGRSALGIAHLPTGTTAAKGLAALPDGGAHFRRARWRAFTRAHWPSILLRQGYGGQGRSALPRPSLTTNH